MTRKQAKADAARLASLVYDRDKAGKLAKVEHPLARDLLTRAFAQLILRGGEPFAMHISAKEAATIPSHVPIAGGSYAMAVGFDIEMRATFSTAGAAAADGQQSIRADEIARHIAMMHLMSGQQIAGIPRGVQL